MKTPSRPAEFLDRFAAPSLAALVAALASAPAHAEPMFVIDKVLINVYAEPNQDARRVETLETGDTVEAIDRLDPYIQVRLPDGREGWVRANYLSKQAPAILRLKELQSGQPAARQGPSPQLLQELEELKKQRAALEGEVAQLRQAEVAKLRQDAASKSASSPPSVKTAKPEPVQQAARATPMTVAQPAVRNRMWAWFAATVTAGALGFLLGYQTLATRIKRKYGNIKIY